MWSAIVLSVYGYFVSISFAGLSPPELLEKCAWIADIGDLDTNNDGTVGWYAINVNGNPTSYCNTIVDYNTTTGTPDGGQYISWYYECNGEGTSVTKTKCTNNLDCSTGCTVTETFDEGGDTAFKCMNEESCLMQLTLYYQHDAEQGTCLNDTDRPQRIVYGVNGQCSAGNPDPDNESNSVLVECSSSGGNGITMRAGSAADQTCTDLIDGWSSTFYSGECTEDGQDFQGFSGYIVMDQCDGDLDLGEDSGGINGIIDGFDYPDCMECCEAAHECTDNTWCEYMADALFASSDFAGQCYGPPAYYEYGLFPHWCDDGNDPPESLNLNFTGDFDCTEIGFYPFWECIMENDCYAVNVDGDNCCTEQIFRCFDDPVCGAAVNGDVDFNGSSNVYNDIYEYCNVDGVDCTVFQATMECFQECEGELDVAADECNVDSRNYDCLSCNLGVSMSSAIFDCVFSDCWPAFNATFAPMMMGECEWDPSYCTAGNMRARVDAYCGDFAVDPEGDDACDDEDGLFRTMTNTFIDCTASYQNATNGTEVCINANCMYQWGDCLSDTTCMEELNFTMSIGQIYEDDADFYALTLNYYCRNREDGSCSTPFNELWSCVVDNDCLSFQADECYEMECSSKVANCSDNDMCFGTLLAGMEATSYCEMELYEMDEWWMYCGSECDELSISSFSACGDEYNNLETYYQCKSLCDGCGDAMLETAVTACHDSDDDCTEFEELMVCVMTNCDEEGENEVEDECDGSCSEQVIACWFDEDCYEDWQYVESRFGGNSSNDSLWIYPETKERMECNLGYIFNSTVDWEEWDYLCCPDLMDCNIDLRNAIFQCMYWDIQAYCMYEGCDAIFWDMFNCMLSCFTDNGIETRSPTTTTTTSKQGPCNNPGQGNAHGVDCDDASTINIKILSILSIILLMIN